MSWNGGVNHALIAGRVKYRMKIERQNLTHRDAVLELSGKTFDETGD